MTKKIAFGLLGGIFLVLSCAVSGICQDEAERIWEQGEKAYNAGRYGEAIAQYQKALAICAGNHECEAANLNGIGASYEAMGDDGKALPYYENALKSARSSGNEDLIATNLFHAGAILYEL